MKTEDIYPKYLSTSPDGEDLLDSKSQEKIAKAMGAHIVDVDERTSQKPQDKVPMPKVIGLEGSWGSGKSNVIAYLKKYVLDEEKYHFFVYDAWSHQEDLQRRSILQKLTHELVEKKVLKGSTWADLPSIQDDGSIKSEKKHVTWEEKLDILMSKKVSTLSKVSKNVYGEFKAFILLLALTPVFATLGNVLKPSFSTDGITYGCWILIVLSFFALIYGLFFLIVWWKFDISNIWKVYADASKEEKNSFQVIHSAEPSLGEFSKWMDDISASLANSKRVIVVFDNMDRLPNDKVKQLWSAIHSMFSNGNLKNIWCLIPYDFSHLATAFGENNEASEQLAKCFIEKSFPVVYRVPAPVVIDYKEIFDQFFCIAFSETVEESDRDKINRCYRAVNVKPNIREIITFVNKCVSLKKTYHDLSIVAISVFVLREDEIIYHPQRVQKADKGDLVITETTTDDYLLCYEFLREIDNIVDRTPNLLKEVAALVYGIDPDRAHQLAIMQAMAECFTEDASTTNLNEYVSNELFFSSLVEVIKGLERSHHKLIVKRLASINTTSFNAEQKKMMNMVWTMLASAYKDSKTEVQELSGYERELMSHTSEPIAKDVAKRFCKNLLDNESNSGDVIFSNLLALENESVAENWDMNEIVPKKVLNAEKFVEYVLEGDVLYWHFPISCSKEGLSEYFEAQMKDEKLALHAVRLLKEDYDYSVADLADKALEFFSEEKATMKGALTCLSVIHLLKETCDVNPSVEYANKLWEEAVKLDSSSEDYIELYVLMLLNYPTEIRNVEHSVSKDLAKKAISYEPISVLLTKCIEYNDHAGYKCLLESLVLNDITDDSTLEVFVSRWTTLVSMSALTPAHMFEYAETWHYLNLGIGDSKLSIKELLPDEAWLTALFESESTIAAGLEKKLIAELKTQPTTYFNANTLAVTASTNYWYKAFIGLMNKAAITIPYGENIDGLVVNVLKYISKGNKLDDANKLLTLIERADKKTVASDMNEIVRSLLNNGNIYKVTQDTFPLLHDWLEYSGINSEANKVHAADLILTPIIQSESCQTIILDKKDYYKPIIAVSQEHSSELRKKLLAIIKDNPDGEFSQYVKSITNFHQTEENDE